MANLLPKGISSNRLEMKPEKAYKHCLICGGRLKKDDKSILTCVNCKFKIYINPLPCNGVILVNDKNEVMLVKRKVEPKKGYWDLPGGFIEPNENLEQSVKREITEELGVDIKIDKIIGVYNDTYLHQGIENPTLGILVFAKVGNLRFKASDDISSYKFFKFEDAIKQKLAFPSIKLGLTDYKKTTI